MELYIKKASKEIEEPITKSSYETIARNDEVITPRGHCKV